MNQALWFSNLKSALNFALNLWNLNFVCSFSIIYSRSLQIFNISWKLYLTKRASWRFHTWLNIASAFLKLIMFCQRKPTRGMLDDASSLTSRSSQLYHWRISLVETVSLEDSILNKTGSLKHASLLKKKLCVQIWGNSVQISFIWCVVVNTFKSCIINKSFSRHTIQFMWFQQVDPINWIKWIK